MKGGRRMSKCELFAKAHPSMKKFISWVVECDRTQNSNIDNLLLYRKLKQEGYIK